MATAKEKYPGEYFRNFIGMLAANYADKKGRLDLSEENINDQILMLVHIEGEDEFRNLKNEVSEIVAGNDLKLFTSFEIKKEGDIKQVAEIISKHH